MTKHQPPEKIAKLGVQMRLTIGQRPVQSRINPTTRPAAPIRSSAGARISRRTSEQINRAAQRPKIMVASDGAKLSVWYPPASGTYGLAARPGKRLRNHVSNAVARLAFFAQWSAQGMPGFG